MTSRSIPSRDPAWIGQPDAGEVKFPATVPQPLCRWLLGVLQENFFDVPVEILGALGKPRNNTGHFLARADGGQWVVHVKMASVSGDLMLAAAIADWLAEAEIEVADYRRDSAGAPEHFADGRFVTVTRYWPGRHGGGSCNDAAALGKALRAAHDRLEVYPDRAAVQRRTAETALALRVTAHHIKANEVTAIPKSWQADAMAAAGRFDPERMFPGSPQPTHGDVSPGNVIFRESGEAVLCDFEDSPFAYRPRSFDIGMAVLRFCLGGGTGPDGSNGNDRSRAFFGAYGAWDGSGETALVLQRVIRGLSDHFLLVMAHLAEQGHVLPDTEWQKAQSWPILAGALG